MADFNPDLKVQQIAFKENVNKWIHPFRCIIAGPTRRRRKNNDVGESLANKLVCKKNEYLH